MSFFLNVKFIIFSLNKVLNRQCLKISLNLLNKEQVIYFYESLLQIIIQIVQMKKQANMISEVLNLGKSSKGLNSLRSQQSKGKSSTKQYRFTQSTGNKLSRQNSHSKLDKRVLGQNYAEQQEIARAFKVHSKSLINFNQTILSIKLLGYNIETQNQFKTLEKIFIKYGEQIDEKVFRQLIEEVKRQNYRLRSENEVFDILTQGKPILEQKRLLLVGQELRRDVKDLLQICGQDGTIDKEQFTNILRITSAIH